MGSNIKMNIRRDLARWFYVDLAGGNTTLIAGSGRSGTSWLANICNYRNDFRYMFEPLNPASFREPQHIESWCLSKEAQSPMVERMLTGELDGDWVDSRNRRFIARRRLIKEIRSNLMLTWMQSRFPKLKIVTIVRNPLMVAASRARLNRLSDGSEWVWKPSLERLLKEPNLIAMLSTSELALLKKQIGCGIALETIADWCINNLVALRLSPLDGTHRVYYEALSDHTEATVKALLEFIGVPYEASVLDMVARPSETSRHQSATNDDLHDGVAAEAWISDLTEREVEVGLELLDTFNVRQLYTPEWGPVHE